MSAMWVDEDLLAELIYFQGMSQSDIQDVHEPRFLCALGACFVNIDDIF